MRFITLLILICPASLLSAQDNLIASETHYKSFNDALYGRETTAEAVAEVTPAAAPVNATSEVKVNDITVERTPLIEEKDTLSPVTSIATALPADPAKPVVEERKIVKKCVALWMDNPSKENMTNCYALHKTALIGSIIQVKNPMNGRSVTVKVIGRLPNHEAYQNISILISAAAARQLHILDHKFIATLIIPESTLYGSR